MNFISNRNMCTENKFQGCPCNNGCGNVENLGYPENGIYIVSPVLFTSTSFALQPETNTAGSRIQLQPFDKTNRNQMFMLENTDTPGLITLTSCVTGLQMRLLMNSTDPSVPIVMDPPTPSSNINVWGLGAPIPQESGLFALFNMGSGNLIIYTPKAGTFLTQTGARFPGTNTQVGFVPIS